MWQMLTNEDFEKVERYVEFLKYVMVKINNYFENQREYICCKQGCTHCCTNGEYPCTEVEFFLLKHGIESLSLEKKEIVFKNIQKILNDKNNFSKDEIFTYICPFLIEDKCAVYHYRMLICRTFGLPYYVDEEINGIVKERLKMPFCVEKGLNYSQVYDGENKMLSSDLYKQKGYKTEPLAYNLSLEYLTKVLAKDFGVEFGNSKPLIDWLRTITIPE